MNLGSGLSSNGQRHSVSPRAEDFSVAIKTLMYIVVIVMVVYGFNRLAKRNREIVSLRAELQELDRQKREQEKILVNLKMELSRMKDGHVISEKARRLGLRPTKAHQIRYSSQQARRVATASAGPTRVADSGQGASVK